MKSSRAATIKNAASKSYLNRSKALEQREITSSASTTPASKDQTVASKTRQRVQVLGGRPGHKKNVSSIMSGLSESDHIGPLDGIIEDGVKEPSGAFS